MIIRLLFAHISMMIANTLSLDVAVLYEETFPAVASFVAKMGGSPDDAKDIFHDAMVVFFEKETDVENPCAYIVGIAKHLWVRKFKHDRNSVDLDENIQIIEEEPSPIVTRLLRLVEAAGRSCLELLQAFYYEKRSAESIADEFKYSNAHSATVQKHKCLQKIRSFVKTKSLDYESFVD
ncbi:MAG: sigma-70 family RNA polymerase sigma factor [Bacteroidota bacterium]